ncbi:chloride channel protein CLC-f-like [Primulina eburnea]|uniref:chloride channel protein CLC-f-like n=1 Tax=Primulina eburnea TaxID=1245227 RepID=UPI003C6CA032
MSDNCLKVSPSQSLREALNCMCDGQQKCVLVVDADDYLEGILTYGDIKRWLFNRSGDPSSWSTMDVDTCNVSSMFTRGISYHGQERGLLTCYPGTDLAMAKQLMETKGIKHLPVLKWPKDALKEKRRRVVAVLYYDSIWICLRDVIIHRKSLNQQQEDDSGI